jgi:dGTPase
MGTTESSDAGHPRGAVADGFAERVMANEERVLSPLAVRSYPDVRDRPETGCGLRTPFQRDRDRIVHSKAFRRLKHKTQVFVAPLGDHYRTRLTHTLEVTQISRTVARALRLNEDLTEAIGLGHDLGHSPFGHTGEEALDRCLSERWGGHFRHYEHSLRIVERLERDGRGLNLTEQVRDGIAHHSGRAAMPATLEGRIVRIVDRVAYLNHDIDDALRAGVITDGDVPAEAMEVLGPSGGERIDALVHDLVENSELAGDIVQGEELGGAMHRLREFMFERVYLGPEARREHARIETVIGTLFNWYSEDPTRIPAGVSPDDATEAERVTDWLAGMTDRFCIRAFEDVAMPEAFAP